MFEQEFVLKSSNLFFLGGTPRDPSWERAAGLYALDTRYLRSFHVTLNGQPLEQLAATVHHATMATATSANTAIPLGDGSTLMPHQIAVAWSATLDRSLHIAFVLENFAARPVSLELGLQFAADFRDVFDIRGFPRGNRGILMRPHAGQRSIRLRYRGLDDAMRGTCVEFDRDARFDIVQEFETEDLLVSLLPGEDEVLSEPAAEDMAGVRASFPVQLDIGERWGLHVEFRLETPESQTIIAAPAAFDEPVAVRTRIATDNPFFNRLLGRSLDDLAALKTKFPHGELTAAGIPWYVAPFGRDSLVAGLQTFHVAPIDAEGTLRVLSALQGKRFDDYTEEQPGKILHEMRYGEMARNGEVPHHPYYGTCDATSLFVLLFAESVAWTASRTLYDELLPSVRVALRWIEELGDLDGDGFIEYWADQASPVKIRHQVWKDSFDSLHHPDGCEPHGNVAPVEVQGYTHAAYTRLADVAGAFGDSAFAAELTIKAAQLKDRFNAAFWLDEEQFYAQALDGDKKPIRAIASNAGQLLSTGIVPVDRVGALCRRLHQPDMDSGWGIRTLSSEMATYNPMSYHNGSVWPHDNSLIAAGFYASGVAALGHVMFEALYDAGRHADDERLNELYCGFSRGGGETDTPVPYPTACSPQAWASGCYPHLIRASLGLAADIRRNVLLVSPQLPPFLNEVTIHDMTALGKTGSLMVCRDGDRYAIESDGLPVERVDADALMAMRR